MEYFMHMKKFNRTTAVILLLSLGVGSAHAAIPTEVSDLLTSLGTDFTYLTALLWPIVALSLGFFILVKWVKRGANKAT
jgi:hypothetical protein